MLELTPTASTVIETLVGRSADASSAGLRIDTGAAPNQFAVAVAPAPQPGDEVVETAGARVFLESSVAEALQSKVLDAQVTEQGGVTFAIADQAAA